MHLIWIETTVNRLLNSYVLNKIKCVLRDKIVLQFQWRGGKYVAWVLYDTKYKWIFYNCRYSTFNWMWMQKKKKIKSKLESRREFAV